MYIVAPINCPSHLVPTLNEDTMVGTCENSGQRNQVESIVMFVTTLTIIVMNLMHQ